jgi:hypothetical protein
MNIPYQYQNTFNDPLAEEFRQILSLPPTFKATDITGCSLWLDASDASTKNIVDGKILNWIDKTTGKDFASQTTTNAPVPGELINGRETVNFLDAISYMRYSGNISYRECFIVCNLQDHDLLGQIIGSYIQGLHIAIDMRGSDVASGTFSFDGNNLLSLTAQYALNNNDYTANFYANTTTSQPQLASNIPQSIACVWNNSATTDTHYIGALLPSFSIETYSLSGAIGEIIIYDRLLTDTERAIIRAYQNQKWGIL